jgi:DNA replication protein DnaC
MKPMSEIVKNVILSLPTQKMVKRDCEACCGEFEVCDDAYARYKNLCPACVKAAAKNRQEREAQERKLAREVEWAGFCPPDFQSLDRERLPRPEKLDEVMSWIYGPKGLILHGESGRGKTRCAWSLMAREHAQGRSIEVMDSLAGLEYAGKFSTSTSEAEKWVKRMISPHLLLMDDIFKNKLTDSFEGIVFAIIDHRIQHQRPTIITSNDTGATLAGRMTQDRANPLLRRLREHCQAIWF